MVCSMMVRRDRVRISGWCSPLLLDASPTGGADWFSIACIRCQPVDSRRLSICFAELLGVVEQTYGEGELNNLSSDPFMDPLRLG